jgi:hypothetical protein
MSWFSRKLDSLIGAVFGGVGGAMASQFDAFVLQYLQRLGGHLDEAQRHYALVSEAERYREMAAEARAILLSDARLRADELALSFRSIAESDLLHRPWAFAANMDSEIAARTWENFRPVLPFDPAGLIYAGVGIVLGLMVYELIKAPVAIALWRRYRHRRWAQR